MAGWSVPRGCHGGPTPQQGRQRHRGDPGVDGLLDRIEHDVPIAAPVRVASAVAPERPGQPPARGQGSRT
jgi:hypothetical protein